jgi:hypothetical protein
VKHMLDRGARLTVTAAGGADEGRLERARLMEREMYSGFKAVAQMLARANAVEDRTLALALAHRFGKRGRPMDKCEDLTR